MTRRNQLPSRSRDDRALRAVVAHADATAAIPRFVLERYVVRATGSRSLAHRAITHAIVAGLLSTEQAQMGSKKYDGLRLTVAGQAFTNSTSH